MTALRAAATSTFMSLPLCLFVRLSLLLETRSPCRGSHSGISLRKNVTERPPGPSIFHDRAIPGHRVGRYDSAPFFPTCVTGLAAAASKYRMCGHKTSQEGLHASEIVSDCADGNVGRDSGRWRRRAPARAHTGDHR